MGDEEGDAAALREARAPSPNSHCTCSGSSAEVGSSRIRIEGSRISALQISRICRSPRLSSRTLRADVDPVDVELLERDRGRAPQGAAVDPPGPHLRLDPVEEVAGDREVGDQAQLLEHRRDPGVACLAAAS